MVFLRLSLLIATLLIMFVSALPEPHRGMINNDDMRDVGVIYAGANFTGTKKFIFETKKAASCLPLFNDVVSIKICKTDVACTFFTGDGCVAGTDNFAVRVGCGDAANVTTPHGDYFKYYRCGVAESRIVPDMEIVTKPHDKNDDEDEDEDEM